ncbi:MAG: 2-oxoacid:acceptor oxidoreductase subunit alpha [Betaproteobacteria bacterium]|nr:2-oxoacid:acceptor oxidoreductase subunit alpha [Betaproteobacteria bacterium]
MSRSTVAIALAGSGGAGVMTIGSMLLEAAARSGYYGLFSRLSGPQVRGGEAAALLRIGTVAVESQPDYYDALVAIDWGHVERFATEIPLQATSLIVGDPRMGEPPEAMLASGATLWKLPFSEQAATVRGGRPNMVALGVVSALLGLDPDELERVVVAKIGAKGEAIIEASRAALRAGRSLPLPDGGALALASPADPKPRWLISGNEAAAVGALRGGIRFVAGYPITPATEVVEWLAPVLPELGGTLLQAEDELAAVGMAVGASYGGVPAMTVTSGPGLSLMVETLGLAIAAEMPLVLIDVMRGGPSTGIPTKSEQSDLNLAIYGTHGDAPRLVLAPVSIADTLATTQWSVELAEALQVPAIVLSDQGMGQTRSVIDAPALHDSPDSRLRAGPLEPDSYRRYAITDSGISPMTAPGDAHGQWIGDGLTHNERGTPSSAAKDHHAQLAKRLRKLESHDFGARWAEVEGDGEVAVITWGSTVGPTREAIARLVASGHRLRHVAIRLLAPLQREALAAALRGVRRVIVVEVNQAGQLAQYLRATGAIPVPVESHARPGPLPLRPRELVETLSRWCSQ